MSTTLKAVGAILEYSQSGSYWASYILDNLQAQSYRDGCALSALESNLLTLLTRMK